MLNATLSGSAKAAAPAVGHEGYHLHGAAFLTGYDKSVAVFRKTLS
jgi:hypothetical protein